VQKGMYFVVLRNILLDFKRFWRWCSHKRER